MHRIRLGFVYSDVLMELMDRIIRDNVLLTVQIGVLGVITIHHFV